METIRFFREISLINTYKKKPDTICIRLDAEEEGFEPLGFYSENQRLKN